MRIPGLNLRLRRQWRLVADAWRWRLWVRLVSPRRAGMGPLFFGLAAGGAVAGLASSVADHIVQRMTEPIRGRLPLRMSFSPFEVAVEWEDVRFLGGNDVPLDGWLLVREMEAPAILVCGGYRSRRSDLLGIGAALWRAGFTVLLFDYHGYGDEPGPATLGYRELADARAALRFLRARRPEAPLGTIGFSMGAAIAIMLAAREPAVRAVVADSPFTSQREIVYVHMAQELGLLATRLMHPLTWSVLTLVNLRLLRRFGFRLDDVHPLREVGALAPRPLLLIHSEDDPIVPVEHSRRLLAAAQAAGVDVEAWLLCHGDHCGAYFADRPAYCRRVAEFFHKHLLPREEERTTNDEERMPVRPASLRSAQGRLFVGTTGQSTT